MASESSQSLPSPKKKKKSDVLGRYVLTFIFTASFLSLSFGAIVLASEETARQATNRLLEFGRQFEKASPGQRNSMMGTLEGASKEREAALIGLLQEDPKAFLRAALPQDVLNRLPRKIAGGLESHVEMTGTLQSVWADDFVNERAFWIHQILTDEKPSRVLELHFPGEVSALSSGTPVAARGVLLKNHLVLYEDAPEEITAGVKPAASSGPSLQATVEVSAALVSGDQSVVVIPVNLTDKAVSCSTSGMQSLMFTGTSSINNYYRETSFQNVSMSGTVTNPVSIPFPNTSECDYWNWAYAADDAAAAAGVPLGNYQRRIYVMPSSCSGWAGLGTYGGNPSRAWILGYCSTPDVWAHELGHNNNMRHASTEGCEYCDTSDIMGYGGVGFRHVNGPHKIQMGWVPSSRVQEVSGSGSFSVSTLQTVLGGYQVLEIPKADTNEHFYVSFRTAAGFDSTLRSQYVNRTNVHRWNGASNTFYQAALADGETFQHSASGVTITQNSHSASASNVSVSLTGPPCVPSAPAVTVSPASQSQSKGFGRDYQVFVSNRDSFTCSSVTFNLSSVIPSGWSSSFSPLTLTLGPGTNGSAVWTVTSAASAPDGTYGISAMATDSANASHQGTGSASFVVFTDALAPTVSFSSPSDGSTLKGRKTDVAVVAQDNAAVAQIELLIDGAVVDSVNGSDSLNYSWNTQAVAAGHHTLLARAADAAGNQASASIVVFKEEKSGGSSGGGGPPPGKGNDK